MCRIQPEVLECKYDKSSLRTSGLLRAEHMRYEHREDVMHDNCKKCGAAFTDREKDLHLNHSGTTYWADIVEVRSPVCQKCEEGTSYD